MLLILHQFISHYVTSVGWSRNYSIFVNSVLAVDVCNCAGPASLGFPSSAGSVHSVPLRLVLVLMLLNVKQAGDAGGSEQCFSSHRRTVQSQDVCGAWGLSAPHRLGRRKSLRDVFQFVVSVFGERGSVWISDVRQSKIKVAFLMPVTSQHVLEKEGYIFFFFLQEF